MQQTIRLRDGRQLGYATFGDPGGPACFLFHGIPGSRLHAALAQDLAAARGVRVIGIDRPGYGLSSYQPGRRFLDWPKDVAALADALSIDRFAVLGISGGAAYAAACALAIPERLRSAGIASGMGPLEAPGGSEWLRRFGRSRRLLAAVARWAPRLAAWVAARELAKGHPDGPLSIEAIAATFASPDRPLLTHPLVGAAVVDDFSAAFRQGSRGVAWDLILYARPWGLRLQDIQVPIHVWHGEADVNVPPAFGHYLAESIPNSCATYYPGEGHLVALSHMDDILQALLG